MKVRLLVALLSSLYVLSANTHAQNFPTDNRPVRAQSSEMNPLDAQPVAFSGTVSVEGGANVMKDTVVVLDCGFGDRARTNVDSKGRFMLMLNSANSPDNAAWGGGHASTEWAACTLRAEAPGYQSTALNLQGNQSGVVAVGTITMSPIVNVPGANAIVSVSSLAAPSKAKKDFAKGQDQAKKGKWAAACDSFRRAIQVYPRYALAWLELGRAQLQQNNVNDAQQSFVSATTQDSRLLPAYVELAHLQAANQEWQALTRTTGNIVDLAPESSAAFWFLDSVANYNSNNLARAESSAERGLRLDTAHRIPQLEYLYALILGSKKNYSEAVQHMQSYLRLSPDSHESKDAQQRLGEFERASAESAPPAR
ncbi:MAG TPA: tetratricopeptide repeat protein [Terriglobales bacterium]|nr:tetratricopeptide repeat protein [Terriglobales bacterium]